jgi:hypothetical protein
MYGSYGSVTALANQDSDVPEPFSDLTPQEYSELRHLLVAYFERLQKRGFWGITKDLLTGRLNWVEEHLDKITRLARLESAEDTRQLLAAVSLICAGSTSPEETEDQIHQAFMKGTRGGGYTGVYSRDEQMFRVLRLATLIASIIWQRRKGERTRPTQ